MKKVSLYIFAILLIAGLALLLAYPVKWLWNWLMPMLFNLKEITFWQAVGVSLLSSFLFKHPSIRFDK